MKGIKGIKPGETGGRLLLEEDYFEVSRGNLSMIAMVLTFLGGFALTALLQLPQTFQAQSSPEAKEFFSFNIAMLDPGIYKFLEGLLITIATMSLLGALAGVLVYIHAGAVQNTVRRVIRKLYETVDMKKLLTDYLIFKSGRLIAELLTYISLGLSVFFLMSLVVFSRGMSFEAIIICIAPFFILILILISRQIFLPLMFNKKDWQFEGFVLKGKEKTRDYPVTSLEPIKREEPPTV